MSYYGDVKKLYRRTYPGYGNLQTGVRTAKMTIYDKLLHFSGSAVTLFDSITEIKSLPAGNVILLVMKPNPVQLRFVSTVKNMAMKLVTVLKNSNVVFVGVLAISHLIVTLHGAVKILTTTMCLNLITPVQSYRLM